MCINAAIEKNCSNIKLPDNLRGRSIHSKIIPTVCNLKIC